MGARLRPRPGRQVAAFDLEREKFGMSALAIVVLIFSCILLVVLVTMAAGLIYMALPTPGTPIGCYERAYKAVLIIDVQEDFATMVGRRAFRRGEVERIINTINRINSACFWKKWKTVWSKKAA